MTIQELLHLVDVDATEKDSDVTLMPKLDDYTMKAIYRDEMGEIHYQIDDTNRLVAEVQTEADGDTSPEAIVDAFWIVLNSLYKK